MGKVKEKISTKLEDNWEIKDRYYYTLGSKQPLTMRIPSQHNKNILYCGLMKTRVSKENYDMLQI